MSYQDKKFYNPPTQYQSDTLAQLADRLAGYRGVDELSRLGGAVSYNHHYPKPQASVLVVITNESTPKLLLTKRSSRLASHAGEIAFVGGHRDEMDNSTADTALREAFEEIALGSDGVSVIGYLPMQQSKSGLWVRPVVGLIKPELMAGLQRQETEIERIFWVDLAYFLHTTPEVYRFDYHYNDHPITIQTPAWYVDGEVLWGLTGRMLANLLQIGFGVQIDWYYRQVSA